MLRQCGRLRQRLLGIQGPQKALISVIQSLTIDHSACGGRHFAAEALRDDLPGEDAEAAQRAVHERLVFELLGIRERFSNSTTRKALDAYQDYRPQPQGKQDRAPMHKAPLSYLMALTEGRSTEDEARVKAAWERQARIETEAVEEAIRRWKEEMASMRRAGAVDRHPTAISMMLKWLEPLSDSIAAEQQQVILAGLDKKQARKSDVEKETYVKAGFHVYGPLLLLLQPEQLAIITLHSTIRDLMIGETATALPLRRGKSLAGQTKLANMARSIGEAVRTQVAIEQEVANAMEVKGLSRILVKLLTSHKDVSPFHIQTIMHRGDLNKLKDDEMLKERLTEILAEARERPDLGAAAQKLLQDIKHLGVMEQWSEILRRPKANPINNSSPRVMSARKRGRKALMTAEGALERDWDIGEKIQVGAALLHHLLETATLKVPVLDRRGGMPQPGRMQEERAFWTEIVRDGSDQPYRRKLPKQAGLIKMHEELVRLLDAQNDHDWSLLRIQPMVVPPLPWRSIDSGGLLFTPQKVMRTRTDAQLQALQEAEAALPNGMRKVYAALNAIGEVSWSINTPIYEALMQAWEQRMQIGSMPPQDDQPLQSIPASRTFAVQSTRWPKGQMIVSHCTTETPYERKQRVRNNKQIRKTNAEHYSQRCDFLNRMKVAENYKDEPMIWFPHTMDFRGRTYPLPPHLNHLGSDTSRGVLQFAEGRTLGESGLDWLFVQVANSWGQTVDKRSFEDRKAFVQEHLELVLDSAERPLEGQRWWQQAEKPWEMLAACREVRDALATGSPAEYVSRLPVQIDGSCNGLQHYAALGRDLEGGRSVNLLPCDKPQDVYTGVAEEVQRIAEADAEEGVLAAQALLGNITRKLVKQTVMTSVYGVTNIGAREQIQARLKDRGWNVTDELTFKVSSYAAKAVLRGLSVQFSQATEMMRWLKEAAMTSTRNTQQPVSWTTPLGLRCVQPYLINDERSIFTVLQKVRVSRGTTGAPNRPKQGSAFPPNYIHSLDSTHMMMTALKCKDAGIAFAGVHDSFWTHAADVPVLARLLREAFVELHSQPLLQQLKAELDERMPQPQYGKRSKKRRVRDPPGLGKLDLNQVLDAEYFFN